MIDYLIVTFIKEEYQAVLDCFSVFDQESKSIGSPRVVLVPIKENQVVKVVIERMEATSNMPALKNTLAWITEYKPKIVLSVGIAGSPPTSDIFLGDVLLVIEILNMTRGAETVEGKEESVTSAYLPSAIKRYITSLADNDLKMWQKRNNIGERPRVERIRDRGRAWNKKINRVLTDNKERTQPKFVDGVIACSDSLIKSEKIMKQRLSVNRDILGNDMESVGVAEACEEKDIPLLIIRGISDIVGLERSDQWKRYACETAASFALNLVEVDCITDISKKPTDGKLQLTEDIEKAIESLEAVLSQIETSESSKLTCKEVFNLFIELPEKLKKQYAPRLFDTLDRPMKYLGDKDLVLEVANACIACCSDANDEASAECEARARICGTSWVYQRTGELTLAEQEAQKSIEISEGIGSDENLAFCKKCLGRLNRLQAEKETNLTRRNTLFENSQNNLKQAIELFGKLGRFGVDSYEVGDCYSLLGRTYLSASKIDLAWDYAIKASKQININSKDYLDLRILEGDILAAKENYDEAIIAFEDVQTTVNQDYQFSEIVARAHYSKANTLNKMNRNECAKTEFGKARKIWESYEEYHFAADAEWGEILIDNIKILSRRVINLLIVEKPIVRCKAFEIYKEREKLPNRRVIAQRQGADITIWKILIKEAKKKLAQNRTLI